MAARIAELRARNEMKSRILVNLLHELRSPLVAVRGYTRMVLEGRGGPVSPAQQQFLNIVADNTQRLVTSVSHAAQLDPDELQLAPCDLLDLWRSAVERIRPAAEAKAIRISERAPGGCHEAILDGERIALVFETLLANSVKFAGQAGEIIGEFNPREKGVMVVRISDSGPGIPAGLLEKMFDRYCRPESGKTGEEPDVRLPLVYDIVRLHGGRLSAASSDSGGCTFVVELPAIQVSDL